MISFFLLPICRDEFLSASNIITFLLLPLPFDFENDWHVSDEIPFQEYLSEFEFLVNLTTQNREIFNGKPRAKSYGHECYSQ